MQINSPHFSHFQNIMKLLVALLWTLTFEWDGLAHTYTTKLIGFNFVAKKMDFLFVACALSPLSKRRNPFEWFVFSFFSIKLIVVARFFSLQKAKKKMRAIVLQMQVTAYFSAWDFFFLFSFACSFNLQQIKWVFSLLAFQICGCYCSVDEKVTKQ